MSTMRAVVALGVALLMVATSVSGAGGDAGSGQDAGATRESGLPIAYGAYSGRLGPDDRDWYRAPAVASPSCLEASIRPVEIGVSASLGFERNGGLHLVNQFAPTDRTTTMGVSGLSWTAGVFGSETSANKKDNGVAARPTDYTFSLNVVGQSPREAADALTGTDASGTLLLATPVVPGCVPGHLDPLGSTLGDNADAYRVDVPAGASLVYSLGATSGAPVELRVYDAQQQLVGTIGPDGLGSVTTTTASTYYLSASRTAVNVDNVPYLVGIVIGPPDPGSGCRPMCLS